MVADRNSGNINNSQAPKKCDLCPLRELCEEVDRSNYCVDLQPERDLNAQEDTIEMLEKRVKLLTNVLVAGNAKVENHYKELVRILVNGPSQKADGDLLQAVVALAVAEIITKTFASYKAGEITKEVLMEKLNAMQS